MENGHTLHLVERQPSQAQLSSGTGSGEAVGSNGSRGWFRAMLLVQYIELRTRMKVGHY